MATPTITGAQNDSVIDDEGDVVRRVRLDIVELRGLLRRHRRRAVIVQTMNAAILRQHAKTR